MDELIKVKEVNGNIVVSSRELSKNFNKEHSKITRDIENIIKGLAKSGDTYESLFINSRYKHPQNKQWYKEYLLTRDGFSLLVMSFNGSLALKLKVKYIESFNKMEDKLKRALNYYTLDKKTTALDIRIERLENNMTIDYGQQEEINKLARSKILYILGGKEAKAYKELNKKAFSTFWKDYKRVMNVNSYKNTAVKDLPLAKRLIIEWKAPLELQSLINESNNLKI
ncbi:MAG: Rha family transcriptional regulator [Clostridium sp.]|uniref:Rha family transcriptional regulator n=1 Tax=Clostridium sp. TaxID=1506 RepID=UPI003EE6CAA9